MKCKFCGSENTKDISVTYIGDAKEIHRHALAECLDCKLQFGYTAITEIPKIISATYDIPKEKNIFFFRKEIEAIIEEHKDEFDRLK